MKTLEKIFEEKKIESEFQNREEHTGDAISAPYQPLLDELKLIRQKMKTYAFQGNQLQNRLRSLKKNYYDDMTIIDSNYKAHDGEVFPWNSTEPYTSQQYESWLLLPMPAALHLEEPVIDEVAIRKAGNEKQIQVLENTCRRIQNLYDMAKTLKYRQLDIKKELNDQYGGTLASDLQ